MAGEATNDGIIRPVDVERDEAGDLILEPGDDTRMLDIFGPEAINRLRVRRLGHELIVGNAEVPLTEGLVYAKSPNDEHYRALLEEAGPDGIPHHPV